MSQATRPAAPIGAIHESATRLCLAITGGGSEAIGELLRDGGGSRTLLSARVPYHPEAFRRYLGGPPDRHCSPEAARDLAMAAYQEALTLAPGERVAGVGATCALAKGGEREGRSHRAFVALQSAEVTLTLAVELGPGRDRAGEEGVAAALILDAIAEGCGVDGRVAPALLRDGEVIARTETRAPEAVARVVAGQADRAAHPIGGGAAGRPAVLFPGSFNPLHDGHLRMAAIAHERTGESVHFEVAAVAFDKPPLNYTAWAERLAHFERNKAPHFGHVWLTRAASFVDKARLFPGALFVVGFDTLARIGDPAYYGDAAAMERAIRALADEGARFLVFPRRKPDGSISDLDDFGRVHGPLRDLATLVPTSLVEDVAHIASRHLRVGPAKQP